MANSSALVAWLGFFVSLTLGILRAYELWSDRTRIRVSYRFSTDANVGNTFYIHNLSRTPLILSWWSVTAGTRWRADRDSEIVSAGMCDWTPRQLPPHDTFELTCAGEDHFRWTTDAIGERSICLVLYCAGNRKRRVRVRGPEKVKYRSAFSRLSE